MQNIHIFYWLNPQVTYTYVDLLKQQSYAGSSESYK